MSYVDKWFSSKIYLMQLKLIITWSNLKPSIKKYYIINLPVKYEKATTPAIFLSIVYICSI